VKRGHDATKIEAILMKKAKLDEGRLALRGPHLEKVTAEGGIVLTVGTGDAGQVLLYFILKLNHFFQIVETCKFKSTNNLVGIIR